jgi:hypothetical protein
MSMNENRQQRRTAAQIRAGNLRLGFVLLGIVAAFFVAIIVKQWLFR